MTQKGQHPLSVSSVRLVPLLEQAQLAEIDISEFFSSLDLSEALSRPSADQTISLADYYRIQNRLMILVGDETLHLSSRPLLPGSTDFVLRNVGACATLYEVLTVIAQTYNLLHGGTYNTVSKSRHSINYVIDDRSFPYAPYFPFEFQQFSIECILIFLHCMLMTLSDLADDAVRSLCVRRLSPGGDCGHLGYWAAPIKFGSEVYSLDLSRDILEVPITLPPEQARSSNAVYQKIVETVDGKNAEHAQVHSMTARVRDSLQRGVTEQSDIAAQLGVSVSTLRRRLEQEGSGFRILRRAVLNDTACRMLEEKQSIPAVSDALGFSEFRAFNRAFKDWNGMTPKAFLRAHKVEAKSADKPPQDDN